MRHRAESNRENEAGTQETQPRWRQIFPPSRRGLIGAAVACALLAGGGLTAVTLMGSGHGAGGSPAADDGFSLRSTAAGARATASGPPAMPQVVSSPQMAVMPSAARTAGSRATSASGTASGRPASSGNPAPSGGGMSSGAPASTAPVSTGSASCTHPSFSTSATDGMWNQSPYFVSNNMWNASGYSVSQTLDACSYSNWYVTATMNNGNGDGAVKTYPNSQRDFSSEINSLSSVTSTFAETSPGTGIYEDAYDIWINGLATSGSTEVMIWTQNNGQTPSGSSQGTVTFGGRSYTVWKSGSYIAFVANSNFTSGSMNLLQFFQWIIGKGWIPSDSTLSQVCYGVELVSTNSAPATFTFSNYSVSAS